MVPPLICPKDQQLPMTNLLNILQVQFFLQSTEIDIQETEEKQEPLKIRKVCLLNELKYYELIV